MALPRAIDPWIASLLQLAVEADGSRFTAPASVADLSGVDHDCITIGGGPRAGTIALCRADRSKWVPILIEECACGERRLWLFDELGGDAETAADAAWQLLEIARNEP